MVKCRDCKAEMVYIPTDNDDIILICPNPECDFKSSPIKIDQSYLSHKKEQEIVKEKSDERVDENISEIHTTKTPLNRAGKVDEIMIYCMDFSTRMDIEINYDDYIIDEWKNQINKDNLLSDSLKNELVELINPPISFFRAIVFSIANLLLENIKKMTHEDFSSFQIISLAGKSDEIFRFPSFIEDTTTEIIKEFIDILNITRQEYRSLGELSYRDFKSAIQIISDLVIELRESYPLKEIKIFMLTIGPNKTKENKYINLIREIKEKLENLMPFSFNIINFNGIGLEGVFGQITRRFSGIYSNETTLKGLINSVLYQNYGTDPYQHIEKIQDSDVREVIQKKSKEFEESIEVKPIESIPVVKTYTEMDKEDISMVIEKKKDTDQEFDSVDLPNITLKRKADDDIEGLIEQLR